MNAYQYDPENVKKAEKYVREALALGASHAVLFEAPQICWDSRTLLKCMYGCSDWGKNHTCPSRAGNPTMAEMREMFSNYKWGIIIHAGNKHDSQRISMRLESMAFHVPTITTSLSGYGVWCEEQGCTTIDKGVAVIYRNDSNTDDVINHIVNTIEYYLSLSPQKTAAIRKSAVQLALQAEWKNFFSFYREAYTIALKKTAAR